MRSEIVMGEKEGEIRVVMSYGKKVSGCCGGTSSHWC